MGTAVLFLSLHFQPSLTTSAWLSPDLPASAVHRALAELPSGELVIKLEVPLLEMLAGEPMLAVMKSSRAVTFHG